MTTDQALQIAFQHHRAARLAQAEELYRRILASQPNHFEALHLLGLIAHQVGRSDAAVDLMRRSIAINASNPGHHCNLGEAYRALDRLDEAVAAYSMAIQLKADYPEALCGLGTVLMKQRKFDAAVAAFCKAVELNPVFVEAWFNLAACRQAQFKVDEAVDAYSTAIRLNPDCGEAYTNLGNLLKDQGRLDEALAAYERAMALLPNEPVCHSNWVYAMHLHPGFDARAIYDAHRQWNQQHAARLTSTAAVHSRPAPDPDRRLRMGYVSPNFNKVSPGALEAWCQLLREMPGSRLMLQAEEGRHRQRVIDALNRAGVDPQRLKFVAYLPGPDYFRLYHEIDITLDPFPCAGGTTSCDALWMGVPVVTLAGRTAVGRAGVSILSNVGLPELIAYSQDQYLNIVRQLAGDLPRLVELRAGLRGRMLNSPLTDAPRFAQNVEAAYGGMWRKFIYAASLD